jgi:tRNA(Ile)-lysidine synthase
LEQALSGETVRDQDLDLLFGAMLAPFRRAVLAVSGGSDSMALMVLVARWLGSGQAPPGLTVDVATVDHGLRAGSADEAEWVAGRAKALGLTHTTLVWTGEKPGSAVQQLAREARYALLAAHASAEVPAAVVTAHTEDDQAETLLMRLGRGSGLDGLSGMARARTLFPDGSVQLVRPLLGLSKSFLTATLRAAGDDWLDDPSNERLDFERVRLRSAQASQAALGLSNSKLALSARRLLRAREALEAVAEARLATLVDVHEGAYASLERARLRAEPAEVRIRILGQLLRAFGGDARPAQLSQIETLDAALARDRPHAQTLGGCMISQGRTKIRLYREPGIHTLPELTLHPGEDAVWDWRFRIGYGAMEDAADEGDEGENGGGNGLGAVSVRALGFAAYATLRRDIASKQRPPARAAASLPSVWSGGQLIAVPALTGAPFQDRRFTSRFLGFKRGPT